jgi:hypothetical protein
MAGAPRLSGVPVSRFLNLFAIAAAISLATAGAAAAATSPVAVGANLGTTGLGAEVQFQVAPGVVVRGDADWLSVHHNEDYSGVDYRGTAKAATGGVFLDWHPGNSGFLVSGGGYFGDRKLDLDARPGSDVNIGGQTFTPAQAGRIEGRAKMSSAQPFVGLGWDTTFTRTSSWGLRVLAGASFSKSPDVRLTSVGGQFSTDPTFLTYLRQEEADVRHDAKDWKYYPVLQVGLTHRF